MAGGAPPPPLQLVERPEEEPLEEGAGLGLAIRVQCESLDCQALLEVGGTPHALRSSRGCSSS